jgi:hypothetical protein
MMIGIPAGQTGMRAGDGCSRKFLRIRRLSIGRSALREEQRAPSDSQHWLAVLLPPAHLLKVAEKSGDSARPSEMVTFAGRW